MSICAVVALVAMVLVDTADVGAQYFFNAPIHGGYEIVALLLAAAGFLAIPENFLLRQHITVELVDHIVPARISDALRLAGVFAAGLFCGVVAYAMLDPVSKMVADGETTFTLGIPLVWTGGFMLVAFAASALAAIGVFIEDLSDVRARRKRS
jgi:TRAP-type C4-dicarboxylate transport system permease small subunit